MELTASVAKIIWWKESLQVNKYYHALFEQNNKEIFWVSTITRSVFSTVVVLTLTNYHYVFTLAVDFENRSLSYGSAKTIMTNKLASHS
ncbi:4907_t:CDS:2 [Dentiscutata heterogama]|uniref:4907_t:CDS:1 n=1 Tax=Dentiscutata heterogama TaxID=1316150 RepID=A0ACA9KYX1_9GLOM|nr:4907_t:CDS:2 [Dentiscutata heterogama]